MSSNKGKYFEVGETFKEGDVELKVAKPTCICVGCYYDNENAQLRLCVFYSTEKTIKM